MNLAHHHNTMILFYNNVLLAVLELVAAHMILIPDSTQFADAYVQCTHVVIIYNTGMILATGCIGRDSGQYTRSCNLGLVS